MPVLETKVKVTHPLVVKEALLTVGLTIDEAENQEDATQTDSETKDDSHPKAAQAEGKAVKLIEDEVCICVSTLASAHATHRWSWSMSSSTRNTRSHLS